LLSIRFDTLSSEQLKDATLAFFQSATDLSEQRDDIVYTFNCLMPRLNFLKNVPQGATCLDLGAGEGSLATYRNWPLNKRDDIRLLALSLDQGSLFHLYDGVELRNFETDGEIFAGEDIGAVFCCHFIEHMSDPTATIDFLSRRLTSGSRVYLEWPHEISKRMPSKTWLRDHGVSLFTSHFFDDGSHIEAWDMQTITSLLRARGFGIETLGRVILPHASSRLRDAYAGQNDEVINTMAFWAHFGWAQYLIAEKL
jgi:hypothetical protein